MIGPDERNVTPATKDSSLWFNVESVDQITNRLKNNDIVMDIEAENFYERAVVTFSDIIGFQVSFCSALNKSP